MNYINQLIEESAQKWNVPLKAAKNLFWIPVIGTLIVLAIAVVNIVFEIEIIKDIFRFLLEEDGPVEWVGALAFLASGILGFIIAYHLRSKHWFQAFLFVGFGLAMLFAAGEEISWGQRIIGWDTPEALLEINDQNETSLHNIGALLDVTNMVMLLIGLYGSVAYLVNKRVKIQQYWEDADYLFIPPFFVSTFFVFIFLFRMMRLVVVTDSNFTLNRLSEWVETLAALGILIFIWHVYRYVSARVRVSTPSSTTTDPAIEA